MQRIFRITEKAGLRFRAEFFNILNHPDFGGPINSLPNALFGRSTQTLANALGTGGANGGLNPLYQIGGPRSVQLALKPDTLAIVREGLHAVVGPGGTGWRAALPALTINLSPKRSANSVGSAVRNAPWPQSSCS